jgi:hypothetical protein
MSMKIDTSQPLTDEIRQYLTDRGRLDVIAFMEQLEAERDSVIVEEVDEPYEKWKVEELRDELRNRKLSDEGKKDELVKRLESDDEKSQH